MTKTKKIITTFLSSIIFLFIHPHSALATTNLIISEVYPAPLDSENEWVELYNPTAEDMPLTGYTLSDQLSTPSVIFTSANQHLAAHSFLTIDLSTAKLNNSGDGITLQDSAGNTLAQMSYTSSTLAKSWSLNQNGEYELTLPTKNAPNFFPLSSPTPTPAPSVLPSPTDSPYPANSPTPTPSPTPSPSPTPTPNTDTSWHHLISITDFTACPDVDSQESITLFNTDTTLHTLSNWRVRDKNNQTRIINLTLPAEEKQVFSWNGSLLNNTGDEFQLENENQEVIQEITYDGCGTFTSTSNSTSAFSSTSPTPSPQTSSSFSDHLTDNTLTSTSVLLSSSPLLQPSLPPPPPLPTLSITPTTSHYTSSPQSPSKLMKIIHQPLPLSPLLGVILGSISIIISTTLLLHEKLMPLTSVSIGQTH